MHMTKISMGCILAAGCLAIQPSFAQPTGPTTTRFVVTPQALVFGKVTPNSGIQATSFTVRAFSGQSEVQVPFIAFSSNGALAISFSTCSGAKPSVQFGTPVTLVACLDTQKVVRGNYAFVLTIRYQKLGGTILGEPTNEPRDVTPVNCTALTTGTLPDLHVAVNVAVSATGGQVTASPSPVSFVYSSNPALDQLQQPITIDYVNGSPGSSDAIDSIAFAPASPPEGTWVNLATDCTGTIKVDLCTITITADPFKLIGAVAGNHYTSTVPIQANSGGHSDLVIEFDYLRTGSTQLFPHLADGGEFQTDFLLVNPTSIPVCVDLKFHLDGNAPALPIISNGLGTITALGITGIPLPPSGSALFQTVGSPSAALVSGWVEIVSPVQLNGQAKFTRHAGDGKYYQGSVPVTLPKASFGVPYDTTKDSNTGEFFISGLAVANPDSAQSVQFTCTDSATGASVGIGPGGGLPGFGHFPQVLSVLSNPPRRGTLFCTATHPVGVLGLSFAGSFAFSSVPII
jgi:hypothetical protein